MKVPAGLKPACWGAAGGAVAVAIIGFSYGGWVTGATAERQAGERAQTAVVNALAPICVDRFLHQANAAASLAELIKTSSWDRSVALEKDGWATMPGSSAALSGVARSCAELLAKSSLAKSS